MYVYSTAYNAKSTVISLDFLVWKFFGKAQFPHSFGRIARTYAEIEPFRKISTLGNQVKLWYFSQLTHVQFPSCLLWVTPQHIHGPHKVF